MTALLIISNILGWSVAALLLIASLNLRRNNRRFYSLYTDAATRLRAIEHEGMVRKMDAKQMQWLNDENARLSRKCAAICAQIRKIKGRGKVTCQMAPQHHF